MSQNLYTYFCIIKYSSAKKSRAVVMTIKMHCAIDMYEKPEMSMQYISVMIFIMQSPYVIHRNIAQHKINIKNSDKVLSIKIYTY